MKLGAIFILLLLFSFGAIAQSSSVQTLIKEGMELHDQKEYKQAIKKFEQALKINPQSVQAIYEMSLSYLELKDYRNASKYSTQIIHSNNKGISIGAYAVKSEALVGMGQIEKAITLLQEGLRKNGDSHLLHFNLALNYYKTGDLDKTIEHANRAIQLNKTNSGAFLLNAYAQKDKGWWLRSIYSFQMFLLLEPDSERSKNAFDEMIQVMLIKPQPEIPVERSFIQQQLSTKTIQKAQVLPPLSVQDGVNRKLVYQAIILTIDSLKKVGKDSDILLTFKEVNRAILHSLDQQKETTLQSVYWGFLHPFFTTIVNSEYYDTFARYISVSYLPESLEWWKNNKQEAEKFIHWFETGESKK